MPLGPLLPVWCICLRSLDRQESSALHGQGLLWLGSDTELQLAGNSCLHSWQVAPSLPSGRSLPLAECHVHFPLWCHYPYHTPDGHRHRHRFHTWADQRDLPPKGLPTLAPERRGARRSGCGCQMLVDLGDLKRGYQSDSKWPEPLIVGDVGVETKSWLPFPGPGVERTGDPTAIVGAAISMSGPQWKMSNKKLASFGNTRDVFAI